MGRCNERSEARANQSQEPSKGQVVTSESDHRIKGGGRPCALCQIRYVVRGNHGNGSASRQLERAQSHGGPILGVVDVVAVAVVEVKEYISFKQGETGSSQRRRVERLGERQRDRRALPDTGRKVRWGHRGHGGRNAVRTGCGAKRETKAGGGVTGVVLHSVDIDRDDAARGKGRCRRRRKRNRPVGRGIVHRVRPGDLIPVRLEGDRYRREVGAKRIDVLAERQDDRTIRRHVGGAIRRVAREDRGWCGIRSNRGRGRKGTGERRDHIALYVRDSGHRRGIGGAGREQTSGLEKDGLQIGLQCDGSGNCRIASHQRDGVVADTENIHRLDHQEAGNHVDGDVLRAIRRIHGGDRWGGVVGSEPGGETSVLSSAVALLILYAGHRPFIQRFVLQGRTRRERQALAIRSQRNGARDIRVTQIAVHRYGRGAYGQRIQTLVDGDRHRGVRPGVGITEGRIETGDCQAAEQRAGTRGEIEDDSPVAGSIGLLNPMSITALVGWVFVQEKVLATGGALGTSVGVVNTPSKLNAGSPRRSVAVEPR